MADTVERMEPLSSQVPAEMKEDVIELADREHRSVGSVVRQALREFLDRRNGRETA